VNKDYKVYFATSDMKNASVGLDRYAKLAFPPLLCKLCLNRPTVNIHCSVSVDMTSHDTRVCMLERRSKVLEPLTGKKLTCC